ncbi:MAG: class I SAM-dependent methyltransferase family protein [Candidatus Aenigmarchaeota archaeon]|nr:class I SAM-dependent methyltransferase family protein [Candidatus Aenigmarchaeota archaeon]
MDETHSYDIVGNIAIIEVPEGADEKLMANEIMKNKNIITVVKKLSAREGVFRTRQLEVVAGKQNLETIHTEHGMKYKLDVGKVYFSPREGEERQKIADKIRNDETVLVMFAGIGAYAIAITKKKPQSKVYAVEINSDAYEYMRTNIRLNRVDALVYPLKGDVRIVCKGMDGKFDRVVMPYPAGAHEFLDIAIGCLKKNGFIHFYTISKEGEEDAGKELLGKEANKLGRKTVNVESRKVLPYAPRMWKRCVEAQIV